MSAPDGGLEFPVVVVPPKEVTESIQEKLHKAADAKLKERIEASINPLLRSLENDYGLRHHWPHIPELSVSGNTLKSVWPPALAEALIQTLFASARDKSREAHVNAFMGKIEEMQAELEELKGRIE